MSLRNIGDCHDDCSTVCWRQRDNSASLVCVPGEDNSRDRSDQCHAGNGFPSLLFNFTPVLLTDFNALIQRRHIRTLFQHSQLSHGCVKTDFSLIVIRNSFIVLFGRNHLLLIELFTPHVGFFSNDLVISCGFDFGPGLHHLHWRCSWDDFHQFLANRHPVPFLNIKLLDEASYFGFDLSLIQRLDLARGYDSLGYISFFRSCRV